MLGQVGLRMHAAKFTGRTIEWATDSETHHTVIGIGMGRCVSAEWPRVVLRRTSDYPSLVWSRFDLTDRQKRRIVYAALDLLNRPYNVPVLFVHLAHKLGIPTPKRVTDWLIRRPAVDCSQLCDLALSAGGVDLFAKDSLLVTPADFQVALDVRGMLDEVTPSRTP